MRGGVAEAEADLRESVSMRDAPEGSDSRLYLVVVCPPSSLEMSSSWSRSWSDSCLLRGESDRDRERESELDPESDRGFPGCCLSDGRLSIPDPEPEDVVLAEFG